MSTPLVDLPRNRTLLSATETAAALGTGERVVITHLARGRFPHAWRTPGGRWRVPVADVAAVRVQLVIDGERGS